MFLVFIILLFYASFILWLLNSYKNVIKFNKSDNGNYPFVSIVVAAKNESEKIPQLLLHLKNQNYPNDKYEIIIVDDKSTDNTLSIIKEYNNSINNFTFISIDKTPEDWSSKKWAIYNGIKKSKGDIILQTDADCYMSADWINLMIHPFDISGVGFVFSLTPIVSKTSSIFKNLLLMDSIAQDIFSGYASEKDMIFSCNARSIAYRKEIFLNIGGYSEINNIISGDDDLLLHKMVHYSHCKVQFIAHKDAAVFSEAPSTLISFINQRLRYASKGYLYYQKKFISKEFKMMLPFLYLINVLSCILILKFCYFGSPIYFIALLFKIIPDYFMIHPIYQLYNIKWSWISFIILSICHPFYIVSFGLFGQLNKVQWK